MSQQISGDAKRYAENKDFLQRLFKTVTDSPLTKIIEYITELEEIIKNKKNNDQGDTVAEVLNGCKEGNDKTVIHFAAARGHVKIFDYLVKEGCDFTIKDKEGNDAFFTAIAHRNLDLVKYLIEEQKVNVNSLKDNDQQPLHIACNSGDLEMVKLLVQLGGDVNATSSYGKPINWAAATQQIQIVKFLLENKACPNGDKKQIPPPMTMAVDSANKELLNLLLDAGADVNTIFQEYSVLHVAAENGNIEFCEILVNKGADTELESENMTPLEFAKKKGQFGAVSYLRKVTKKAIKASIEQEIEQQKIQEQKDKEQKEIQEKQKALSEEQQAANAKKAAEKKEEGNVFFQKDEIEPALVCYEEAIELDPKNVVYYSNKAACLIKQKKYQECLDICQVARKVNDQWTKVFFREGQAYTELNMHGDAAASYWEAMRCEPGNKLYKQLFDRSIALGKKYAKEQQKAQN